MSDSHVDKSNKLRSKEDEVIAASESILTNTNSTSFSGWSSYMNCIFIGHPFLRYNIRVTKTFLKRNFLDLGNCYWMETEARTVLNEALSLFTNAKDILISAGGEALSTAIAAQSIIAQPKSIVFMGSKAADKDAIKLNEACKGTQLGFKLEEKCHARTNVHVVFHCNSRWCEMYYIDRENHFSTSYIDKPVSTKVLERSNVIYTCDTSLLMMPEAVKKLAYYANASFKVLCISLCNPNIIIKFKVDMVNILSCADIIFITEKCAKVLLLEFNIKVTRKCCSFETWIPKGISKWVKSFSKKISTVVVSDGLHLACVTVDQDSGKTTKYKSKFLKSTKIVDFFGVWQGFVGVARCAAMCGHWEGLLVARCAAMCGHWEGYMAAMIQSGPLDMCVESAFLCASMVAGQFGMGMPADRLEIYGKWKEQFTAEAKKNMRQMSEMPFKIFHTPWKIQDVDNNEEFPNATEDANVNLEASSV